MNFHRLVLRSLVAAILLLTSTGSRSDEPAKTEKPTADPMVGKEAGQVRDDNGMKMKLVWCPSGFLSMEQVEQIEKTEKSTTKQDQADHDDPKVTASTKLETTTRITPVKVFLTRGYWIGKYEVTQAEWKHVMTTEPWKGQKLTKEGDDFPATFVNWDDAMEFCHKLTEMERKSGRLSDGWDYTLPTEAQWERACRARTETKFSFGNDESMLGEYAWFFGNTLDAGEEFAHRVGQKKPNAWGLYDMHGNVWEWCRDWYSGKLPGGRDPEVTAENTYRVSRGGGWSGSASVCTSGFHSGGLGAFRRFHLGFRLALSPVR